MRSLEKNIDLIDGSLDYYWSIAEGESNDERSAWRQIKEQNKELLEALIYINNDIEERDVFVCIGCDAPNGCDCTKNVLRTTIEKITGKTWKEICGGE